MLMEPLKNQRGRKERKKAWDMSFYNGLEHFDLFAA